MQKNNYKRESKQRKRKKRRQRFFRRFATIFLSILILLSLFLGYSILRHFYETHQGHLLDYFRFYRADIVLDAGHGGKDPGAIVEDVTEKEITLSIALKTRELLENSGYKVAMTRTDDSFLSLDDRAAYANRKNAKLFISIHCNSSEDGAGGGIETFYSEYKEESAKNPAELIQHSMIEQTAAKDREVKTANYTVLVRTKMPSVLVETGFLTNETERALLSEDDYQEKIAQGITDGILKYFESIKE